ncbi:MAG: hypothetical protein P1V51_03840 [Deltaproteobacteria bacterium]|nr:hypothetical protein [Deltaproteobacteria bacterium]
MIRRALVVVLLALLLAPRAGRAGEESDACRFVISPGGPYWLAGQLPEASGEGCTLASLATERTVLRLVYEQAEGPGPQVALRALECRPRGEAGRAEGPFFLGGIAALEARCPRAAAALIGALADPAARQALRSEPRDTPPRAAEAPSPILLGFLMAGDLRLLLGLGLASLLLLALGAWRWRRASAPAPSPPSGP